MRYLPQNVMMFGVQIAFYLIFILVLGNEKLPRLINAFNMFISFYSDQLPLQVKNLICRAL